MKKSHNTEVMIKQTAKTTKYIYMVDGKAVRTSTRKYVFSTADGSYFSSRMDLLLKNADYQRDLQYAVHRANLTEEQHKKEQEKQLLDCRKEYNKYNSTENRDKWVKKMVEILYHFGNTPTEQEVEERRKENLSCWNKWLEQSKERLDKKTAFMNDPDALLQNFNEIRSQGQTRLQALDIVTYNL